MFDATTPDTASTSPGLGGRRGPALQPAIWAMLMILATVMWIVALARTNTDRLGDWGLFAAFPIIWFISLGIAFVLCLAGITAKSISKHQLTAGLTLLTTMMFASPNIVEDAPRLPWVYKHIAVTRYIDTFHSVNPSIDLYHRWPGFFSVTAFLGEVIGYHDPVSYAAWAEVGFALIDLLLVVALARAISSNAAWAWTAGLVFTIANWISQNYFAPQALGYTLYLTVALIALRYLRSEPRRLMSRVEGVIRRLPLMSSSERVSPKLPATDKRHRVFAIAAVLVMNAVIVASHQLTPYLALMAMLPLFVVGYLRPTWVGFVMFATTVLYLVPNFDYMQQNFALFTGFDPVANATYSAVDPALISAAAQWQGRGVIVLSAFTIVLAFLGFLRRLRQGHVQTTVIVLWMAVAPALSLLGQTYGGEGRFRVFLFGLPWYAMGVAWLFWSGVRNRRRIVTCWVAVSAMMTLFVATHYQPEADYRVLAVDVQAAEWLDGHLQPENAVVTATANFPVLIGANYYKVNGFGQLRYGDLTTLPEYKYRPFFDNQPLTPEAILDFVVSVSGSAGRGFVIFSDTQSFFAAEHGLFQPGELVGLEGSIKQDPLFTLAFSNGAVRIYQFQ